MRDGDDSAQVVLVDTIDQRVVELPGDMVDCITDIITGRYPEFDYIAEEFDPPRFVPLKLPEPGSGRALRRTSDHANLDPSGLLTVPLSKADAVAELRQLRGKVTPRMVDWPSLEQRLRHPLPRDYKRFMELVGPGSYGDITVADPVESGQGTPSLVELTREALDGLNTDAENPLPEGPIAWGRAPGGWYCGWIPGRYPDDQRPVLLFHPLRRNAQGRGASMTSYLAAHTRDPTNWETARWRVGEP